MPGTPEHTKAQYDFQIQHDRIYKHAILGVNFTSYDMRRCSDCVHPSAERQFVVVKVADDSDHPFWYARVLGVFHTLARKHPREPHQRLELLWVRWLARDLTRPGGWRSHRLDRVSYYSDDQTGDSLPPFDFINPNQVVRGAHLIPAFESGPTFDYLPGQSALAHDLENDGDWKYWYAMR